MQPAMALICAASRTFSYLPSVLGPGLGGLGMGTDLGAGSLWGSADVALSALRGIFEALKLRHKMLLPFALQHSTARFHMWQLQLLPTEVHAFGPGSSVLSPRSMVPMVLSPQSSVLSTWVLGGSTALLSAAFLFVRHFLMTIVLQYKLHKCAIFAFVYAKTSALPRLMRLTPATCPPKQKRTKAKQI